MVSASARPASAGAMTKGITEEQTAPAPGGFPDLVEQIRAIRSGAISAADLLHMSLERAEAVNSRAGVFLRRFDTAAMAAASSSEPESPLAGTPLGIKANIAVREFVATGQSRVYDPKLYRGRDATVVARLRAAGGVVEGATTMVEHAVGRPDPALGFPIPRNPWDLARWSGGSSCGTAIGISLGIFAAGLGTDTSGSCRIPAAFCGVTGLRPRRSSLPMGGILPASPSLDVVGPMARSARDCRVLLELMRGGTSHAVTRRCSGPGTVGKTREQRANRILVPDQIITSPRLDPDTREAFSQALREFTGAGIAIDYIDLPFIDELINATLTIMIKELYEVHRDKLAVRWHEYGRSFRRLVALGLTISDRSYSTSVTRAAELADRFESTLDEHTVFALPTWPAAAPTYEFPHGAPQDDWNLTAIFASTGHPALALPMGKDSMGLPLSLQLIGSRCPAGSGENLILDLGELFQLLTHHHRQAPELDRGPDLSEIPDPDSGLDQARADEQLRRLPLALATSAIPFDSADAASLSQLMALPQHTDFADNAETP